jgi:hypothetical protein
MENVLTSLAYLDAVHDFGNIAEIYSSDLLDSLPGYKITIKDEEEALDNASDFAETLSYLEGSTPNQLFVALGGSSTSPVAIICDASFCVDLIDILKTNNIGKLYFVKNRETENDP